MAIEKITGLYDSNVEAAPKKKRSLVQKLCPYVLATSLFLSPAIINAEEKNNQFDATKYLKNSFTEYIKNEKVPLGIMGVSFLAGWATAFLKGKLPEIIHDASVVTFCVTTGINLHNLPKYINH